MNTLYAILGESLLMKVKSSPFMLVLGALLVVLLIALVWIIVFSKRRRHQPQRRHHWKAKDGPLNPGDGAANTRRNEAKRRRRRKRSPLNPTLAETRGLPPVRDESSAPPY